MPTPLTTPVRQPEVQPARLAVAKKPAAKPPLCARSTPRPKRESLKTAYLAIAGVVTALSLALATFFFTQFRQRDNAPHAAPLATVFNATVAAPGLVESASGLRKLSFEMAGKVKRVVVDEGETVRTGQLLAELENTDLAARVESARADVAAAKAQLGITGESLETDVIRAQKEVDRLKAELAMLEAGPRKEEIAAARAQAAVAEADANRALEDQQKYRDPTGRYESWSKQLYDQAMRQAQAAAARHDAARARLQELEAGTRPEEIERARAVLASAQAELARQAATQPLRMDAVRAQLAQACAELQRAEAELNKTLLVSPIDGTVVWKFLDGGEAIDAIQRRPVLAIADVSRLRVRASVDEADYPRIRAGQKVRIAADAFPDEFFSGVVERVGRSAGEKPFTTGEARERLDVRVIETIVKLDDASRLKLGLRVRAFFDAE